MTAESLRQTLRVVRAWEGMPLNYSTIGRQLDISRPSAKARVQQLVEARMAWLLHPLEAPGDNKARKSPKLYLNTPAGALLSAEAARAQGKILFRSRMIRTVRTLESARHPSSTFWYCGGYGKTHVELIVQTATKRIGFVFIEDNRLSRRFWSYCRRVLGRGIIQAAFVLYPGHRIFFAADRLVVLPAEEFCEHYRRWMNACLGSSRKPLLSMVRTYNAAHAQHLS